MTVKNLTSIPVLALALACAGLRADVIELKNGNILNGTYRGGTAATVNFEAFGNVMQLATSDVVSLTFTTPAPAPAPVAAPVAAPAATSGPVTLPAGTLLLVRMMDGVSSRNAPGANFTTKLEYDLVANGVIVARAGTVIYGKVQSSSQARRARGRSTLDIRLVQMVPRGSPVPISTSSYKEAGEASIKKVARAAAVGAVIGNNTGDGDQGEGAAIGAGIAMLKPGQTLTIAPGTILEFTLQQPVTVMATN
jgi:hypothetical protein